MLGHTPHVVCFSQTVFWCPIARIARMVEIGHYSVEQSQHEVAEANHAHATWLKLCADQGTLEMAA